MAETLYTEAERDQVEARLADERNKINLEERHNSGMKVILYHLMKENISLIYCEDERTNSAAEFEVPNEEVWDWYIHAFAHKDANLTPYQQYQNDWDGRRHHETDGA